MRMSNLNGPPPQQISLEPHGTCRVVAVVVSPYSETCHIFHNLRHIHIRNAHDLDLICQFSYDCIYDDNSNVCPAIIYEIFKVAKCTTLT